MAKRNPVKVLDIETTGTAADTGLVTAYVLLEGTRPPKVLTRFVAGVSDEKRALEELLARLRPSDTVVVWRGRAYDVPFLVTRALRHGLDASPLLRFKVVDLAEFAEKHMRLDRTSQSSMCRFLGIGKNHDLTGDQMPMKFLEFLSTEDRRKAREILVHCEDDVRSLYKIFQRMEPLLRAAGEL
ncbi:MAG: ribonuclease H-like domain-containing protein [Halobacteria archaeon]